jgi:hypothetical protein
MATITFALDSVGSLLIKPDQEVDFKTPMAKAAQSKTYRIHVSRFLGADPKDIFLHLQKVVGESVAKNEVLAEKKTTFGKKQYQSEWSGVVREINHQEGVVLIESSTEIDDIKSSYFKGRVVDITADAMVTLEVKQSASFPLKSAGCGFGGEVKHAPDESQLAAYTTDDVCGKVIIVDSIKPIDAVRLEVLDEAGTVILNQTAADMPRNIARVLNISDWHKIQKIDLPYCIVDAKQATIHFYE